MAYSQIEINKIKSLVFNKIMEDIDSAAENGSIDDLLSKLGINFEKDPTVPIVRNSKIIVFGTLGGKVKDYLQKLHKLNIPEDIVEFQKDYSNLKHFDTAKLEYTTEYSDIILGPVCHKQIGIGEYSSFKSRIEANPEKYPKLQSSEYSTGELKKISISDFEKFIKNTRYYKQYCLNN